jgi:DNA-binding response OmpR family regulator
MVCGDEISEMMSPPQRAPGRGVLMDLRVLVLTKDLGIAELLRTQVENLGGASTVRETYDEMSPLLEWADAAIIDLAGDGLDDLNRLRVECPRLRVLAVATDPDQGESARSAGADEVMVEPFAVADVVDAIRKLGPSGSAQVIDLRTGEVSEAPSEVDGPWFATS